LISFIQIGFAFGKDYFGFKKEHSCGARDWAVDVFCGFDCMADTSTFLLRLESFKRLLVPFMISIHFFHWEEEGSVWLVLIASRLSRCVGSPTP